MYPESVFSISPLLVRSFSLFAMKELRFEWGGVVCCLEVYVSHPSLPSLWSCKGRGGHCSSCTARSSYHENSVLYKMGISFYSSPLPQTFFWWDRNIPPRPIDANSLVCGISDIGLNINTAATLYNFLYPFVSSAHFCFGLYSIIQQSCRAEMLIIL